MLWHRVVDHRGDAGIRHEGLHPIAVHPWQPDRVLVEDMTRAHLWCHDARHLSEKLAVVSGYLSALTVPIPDMRQFHAQDRGLHGVEARVVTEHLVAVALLRPV